jgi:cell wall-associated NlpC family hydrolase
MMRSPLRFFILLASLLVLFQGCQKTKTPTPASKVVKPPHAPASKIQFPTHPSATPLGWAIQAGAFSQVDNAVRLSESLSRQGLEATYFKDKDNLYKVRFGSFVDMETARGRAETLRSQGILEVFVLVAPESLSGHKIGDTKAETGIRKSLTNTAESYIGIPYRWGGTSAETGFDCSGLAQAVYRLNGLSIPRSSRDQYAQGKNVSKEKLSGGDLLFFATRKGGAINHVAIYIGGGEFIHAPRPGQLIRWDNFSNPVLSKQYVGAKSYL